MLCTLLGEADTITITDPEKIKEIKEWKKAKASGARVSTKSYKRRKISPVKKASSDDQKSPSASRQTSVSTSNSNSSAPSKPSRPPPVPQDAMVKNKKFSAAKTSKPPNKPPPRRQTLNAHKRQRSGPLPPVKAINEVAASSPHSSPPTKIAPAPPNAAKLKSINKRPPKSPVPIPEPKKKQKSPKKTEHVTIKEDLPSAQPPEPPKVSESSNTMTKPQGAKHRKEGSRMNMLASISSFKAGSLKHVDAETLRKQAAETPSNVSGLLADTLKNYRQFVMDDDDSDDSDTDWDD